MNIMKDELNPLSNINPSLEETTIQSKLLALIGEKAVDLDWNVAFSGKSKGNRHLFRVNKIAEYLQREEGGDAFITLATAWVHDVSLAFGLDDDPQAIHQHTLNFLTQFELDPAGMQKIAEAASNHETSQTQTIEAQIVHDADVIDKSGMLGVIRHIWKMTNMIENRILTTTQDFEKLRQDIESRQQKLFTYTGQQLFKKLQRGQQLFFENPQALEIMKEISVSAQSGVISDDIAQHLITQMPNSPIIQLLHDQLTCSYLV